LLHQDIITALIVGMTSVEQLREAVAALDIDLFDSELEYLDEPVEVGRW
jgi:aryl-alcohol dehydrogenase-like predicted oxidoreductase